jgi:hypothetical protein
MVCLNFIEIGSNFSVGEKLWNYGTKFAPILEQGNKNHSYLFNFFGYVEKHLFGSAADTREQTI